MTLASDLISPLTIPTENPTLGRKRARSELSSDGSVKSLELVKRQLGKKGRILDDEGASTIPTNPTTNPTPLPPSNLESPTSRIEDPPCQRCQERGIPCARQRRPGGRRLWKPSCEGCATHKKACSLSLRKKKEDEKAKARLQSPEAPSPPRPGPSSNVERHQEPSRSEVAELQALIREMELRHEEEVSRLRKELELEKEGRIRNKEEWEKKWTEAQGLQKDLVERMSRFLDRSESELFI